MMCMTTVCLGLWVVDGTKIFFLLCEWILLCCKFCYPATVSDHLYLFCFSTGGAVEQTVLESVLLPMGRTLGQEEVWSLMGHMVNQVSDTLSVIPDVAQHLLIHCKWNMDLLLQKYTDDSEVLLVTSGLKVPEHSQPESPQPICPVCMTPLSPADNPPSLCCGHSCCKVRFFYLFLFFHIKFFLAQH